MKNTRGLKFLSGVVVVLFLGFIMGGCQKEAIDSDMEGHWGIAGVYNGGRWQGACVRADLLQHPVMGGGDSSQTERHYAQTRS